MKNIKDFIYREFFLKQVIWLAWALLALFFILNSIQINYGIKAEQEKIDTLIRSNKDEIFSSIVLEDPEAIKDHLEIIQEQYKLNHVGIRYNQTSLETDRVPVPTYYKWLSLFSPQYKETLTNEFQTVSFKIEVDFTDIIIKDSFIPFVRTSLLIYGVLLFVIYLFIRRQIKIVQNDIISPMSLLVKQIQADKMDEEITPTNLEELSILAKAIHNYPKLKRESVIGEIASQVAHDIRSPLEALKASKDELKLLPEEDRHNINLAINRIEEISYKLLQMRKADALNNSQNIHLLPVIEQLIQEKRMQYRQYHELLIELEELEGSYPLFVSMPSNTLKSILSNLVTNSVEALGYKGTVKISVAEKDNRALIKVCDSGAGLDKSRLDQYFLKGFTTKPNGNGLGLYNAKKEVEFFNGEISIFSQEANTIVTIELPVIAPSPIFTNEINISGLKKIIILDDDISVHKIWDKRLASKNILIEHFYKAEDLLLNYKHIREDELLLSDFELLGEQINGIDCIKRLNSSERSILVTARWDEMSIFKSCKELGIKLLPKNLALKVPVNDKPLSQPALTLIDDDKLIHLSWIRSARKLGIEIKCFFSIDEFLSASHLIPKNTPIYLDSNLGNNIKGEIEGEKIFKKGFTQIYLSTGYDPDDLLIPNWIQGCLGKQFPESYGPM